VLKRPVNHTGNIGTFCGVDASVTRGNIAMVCCRAAEDRARPGLVVGDGSTGAAQRGRGSSHAAIRFEPVQPRIVNPPIPSMVRINTMWQSWAHAPPGLFNALSPLRRAAGGPQVRHVCAMRSSWHLPISRPSPERCYEQQRPAFSTRAGVATHWTPIDSVPMLRRATSLAEVHATLCVGTRT
jgi:hypothetical protein